jgi:hypothetical protein
MNHNFTAKVTEQSLDYYQFNEESVVTIRASSEFGNISFELSPEGAKLFPVGYGVIIKIETFDGE